MVLADGGYSCREVTEWGSLIFGNDKVALVDALGFNWDILILSLCECYFSEKFKPIVLKLFMAYEIVLPTNPFCHKSLSLNWKAERYLNSVPQQPRQVVNVTRLPPNKL